jgi:hypothetical protein
VPYASHPSFRIPTAQGASQEWLVTRCSKVAADPMRACEDGLEDFWGPLRGEENDSATRKPDGVSGSNVVDFKAGEED